MRRAVVAAVAVLAVTFAACAGEQQASPRDQEELAGAVLLKAAGLAAERQLPWRITQSEFQDDWFVLQLQLNEEAVRRAPEPLALFYFQPMQLYRDAVGPMWHRFEGTKRFILAFRDQEETVIEMSPDDLGRYISGALTDEEMLAASKVSSLTSQD